MRILGLFVALCLFGCAGSKPRPRDTPQFRACQAQCEHLDAMVIETSEAAACFCHKPPSTT